MTINHALFSSDKEDWETPQDLFDALNKEFAFTLDVCATETNKKVSNFIAENSLEKEWIGICWMNPPYGRNIGKWVKKCSEVKGTCVALLPSRTDTKWFHEYVYGKAEIRFLKGRLKFKGAANSAPFPSVIVVFNNFSAS